MKEMGKILIVSPVLVLISSMFGFDVAGIVAASEVFTLGAVQAINYWLEYKNGKADK